MGLQVSQFISKAYHHVVVFVSNAQTNFPLQILFNQTSPEMKQFLLNKLQERVYSLKIFFVLDKEEIKKNKIYEKMHWTLLTEVFS